MIPGLQLYVESLIALKYLGQNLLAGLDQPFGPSSLLRFERGHLYRQFRGTLHILQVNKFPAFELGPIGEIGVFGQRVVLPAARFLDRGRRHTPAVPLKLKKTLLAGAAGVFEHEMPVQQNGFNLGKERVVAIDVGPPGLHHPDLWIGEMVNGCSRKSSGGTKSASKMATNSPLPFSIPPPALPP